MQLQTASFFLFVVAFPSAAHATSAFQCVAQAKGSSFYVKLTGGADAYDMTVVQGSGESYTGRATAYRRNTRFFLPVVAGSGVKLGIDGERSTLCFGDGGTDCVACQRLLSPRQSYFVKRSCAASTSTGPWRVSVYFGGAPTSEMVVENASGEVASGSASESVYVENVASLPYGPNEAWAYHMDTSELCNYDGECWPCEGTYESQTQPAPVVPAVVVATCDRTFDGLRATLSSHGQQHYLTMETHDRETWRVDGPAVALGNDRWRLGTMSFDIYGAVGELCTPADGCGICQVQRPPR